MSVVGPNIVNTVDVSFRLPLMESEDQAVQFETAVGLHEIFVPSRLGGRLTVGFRGKADGNKLGVRDPWGKVHTPDPDGSVRIELTANRRGSGLFGVAVYAPSESYRIFALFDEMGLARTKKDGSEPLIPHNFWYYPFSHAEQEFSAWGSKTLLPIPHYELAFEVDGVYAWEKEHHNDPTKSKLEWAGHCHLAACASILFWPPPDEGVIHKGVTFSCEELKLLAAEFFGRWGGVSDVWGLENAAKTSALHERKPSEDTRGFGDNPDMLVGMLNVLRREIRESQRALVMDLRDAEGKEHAAVWNHAVFRYQTRYWQPHVDDPTLTEGFCSVLANADLRPEGGTSLGMPAVKVIIRGKPWAAPTKTSDFRHVVSRFRIRFQRNGLFELNTGENEWLSTREGHKGGRERSSRRVTPSSSPVCSTARSRVTWATRSSSASMC